MQALFNLFRQAWQSAPLSPEERTLLRGIKSSFLTALIATIVALAGLLNNWQLITPQVAISIAIGTFAHTIVTTVLKYQSAAAEAAQQAPNDVKVGVTLPTMPAQFSPISAPSAAAPNAGDAPANAPIAPIAPIATS